MTDPAAPRPNFDYSAGAAELRGEAYRVPEYVTYLDRAVIALRLVRLIVYAGMAGFLLLAIYGFVLIYRLTEDVHAMVGQTVVITQQMQAMTRTMANLNQGVTELHGDVGQMGASVAGMEAAVGRMSDTVVLMQHSTANLDRSMQPFSAMGRFMPWGFAGVPAAPPYAR